MKSFLIILLSALLIINLSNQKLLAQEPVWEFISSQNGIDLYKQSEVYNGFDEFRAVVIFDCSLEVIAAVLKDFPNYPNWMPECLQAKKIEDIDENSLLLYYLHHSPWPVRNRDAVLRVNSIMDRELNILYISSIAQSDDRFPAQPNPVRMAMMEAHWKIESLGTYRTKISYSVISDPAGYLTASSVNLASKYLPVKTLLGLAKMIKLKRYIQADNSEN